MGKEMEHQAACDIEAVAACADTSGKGLFASACFQDYQQPSQKSE